MKHIDENLINSVQSDRPCPSHLYSCVGPWIWIVCHEIWISFCDHDLAISIAISNDLCLFSGCTGIDEAPEKLVSSA